MKSIYVVADEYYERTNRGQRNFIGTGNKDDKEHGLETWWQPNGQTGSEATYKDDEVIFSKKWNKDGTPVTLPYAFPMTPVVRLDPWT